MNRTRPPTTPNPNPVTKMAILRSLIPWSGLTKQGIPLFKVARRPMTAGGMTFDIDTVLPAGLLPDRRLRQLYEQRLLVLAEEVKVPAVDARKRSEQRWAENSKNLPGLVSGQPEPTYNIPEPDPIEPELQANVDSVAGDTSSDLPFDPPEIALGGVAEVEQVEEQETEAESVPVNLNAQTTGYVPRNARALAPR